MSDPDNTTNGAQTDWRAARRAERRARRDARHGRPPYGPGGGPALGGIILVVVGIVLLSGQLGYHLPERWWAALLLIPAGGALVAAARFWRADAGLSARVISSLIGGLLFLALACAFYFGVNWSVFWPAILILIGLGIVTRGYWQR